MLAVIDSGGANLASIFNAFSRLGYPAKLVRQSAEASSCDRIILPGVGSALKCYQRLCELELLEFLRHTDKPVLGICIGMQLQFRFLEEGSCQGLGLHESAVTRFAESADFPVPHMGWNRISVLAEDPLVRGLDGEYFYFAHSYAAPSGPGTLAVTDYSQRFSSVMRTANWWGVQFHPEKSARAGQQLLKNFMEICL